MSTFDTCFAPNYFPGGLANQPDPRPTPQIAREFDILEKALAIQAELFQRLAEAVEPVLSLAQPSQIKSSQESEPTCPVASRLFHCARRVEQANVTLRDILSRIEL